jgi:hypothetical protein
MRTTLTLEPDVARLLDEVRRTRKIGLKDAVNLAMHKGLQELQKPASPRTVYLTRPHHSGTPRLANLDRIGDVLALAEGDDHR